MESLFGNLVHLGRRRWYVVVVGLLLGAGLARASSSTDVLSTVIVHVDSMDEPAGSLGLTGLADLAPDAVALRAPGNFKRSPDYGGLTATFQWDTVGRDLTFTVTGPSESAVVAAATKLHDALIAEIEQPAIDALTLAVADADTQVKDLTNAAASIDNTVASMDPSDPTRSNLISRAADLRFSATNAQNRSRSLSALLVAIPTLVTSGPAVVVSSAPGITTYAAGAIAAGALLVLAGCAWVLVDRRIRRRIHLERAAPGVRSLGLIGSGWPGAGHIDSVVGATVSSFVRDAGVGSLVLFGVPGPSRMLEALAAKVQQGLDVPVVASEHAAADAVWRDHDVAVGYVAVVRWGKTTEPQLSSAIADLQSVGGLALGTLLIGVPASERSWAGSTSLGDGSVVDDV